MTDIQDPHAEYPKMLFKKGIDAREHQLEDAQINVAGVKGMGYCTVHSADEEHEKRADGWSLTPALNDEPAKPDPRDAEIEELRRQLEEATAPAPAVKPTLTPKEVK